MADNDTIKLVPSDEAVFKGSQSGNETAGNIQRVEEAYRTWEVVQESQPQAPQPAPSQGDDQGGGSSE